MSLLRVLSTSLLALALGANSGAAQNPPATAADLTGTWTFTVNTDGGSGTPTVTLQQQGDSLTGTYSSQIFGDIPLKGAISGTDFTLQGAGAMQGQSFTLTFSGKVKGADDVEGSVDFGGLAGGTFTGKRRPPPA